MRISCSYFSMAVCAGFLLCRNLVFAQSTSIDTSVARRYFQEARTACEEDGGKLWGASLCGPILFVDPRTHMVVGSHSDAEGLLAERDGVFVGRLPEKTPVANAPVTWAGVRWVMIVWFFMTDDSFQRVKVMLHESFHRIQKELGFPMAGAGNNHLDTRDGRFWLQLEWRALRSALRSEGVARRRAVEDALTFRNYRRLLFPKSDLTERALEMNEGLAEYSAFKLTAKTNTQLIDYLTKQIDQGSTRPTFVGSFAYYSGPAYGVLLDASRPNWRKGLTPEDDMGELLQRSLEIGLATDLKSRATERASRYDGDALAAAEAEREATRQRRIADYRSRFVDAPTLQITLTDKRSVTINSTELVPLEGVGTVYPTARVTDEWGILEVSNGALMIHSSGGRITTVHVSLPVDPTARPLKGDGWTLALDSGWTVARGSREGGLILKKVER